MLNLTLYNSVGAFDRSFINRCLTGKLLTICGKSHKSSGLMSLLIDTSLLVIYASFVILRQVLCNLKVNVATLFFSETLA